MDRLECYTCVIYNLPVPLNMICAPYSIGVFGFDRTLTDALVDEDG